MAVVVVERELPEAEDDEASTAEDEAVVVDVLANDTDPDGDTLRVASVTAPAHGTAPVASGRVTYAPQANYHGTDRFTYVAEDPDGLTAEAAVEVTVAPVNDAPVAVGVIPDRTLGENGAVEAVDLGPYFEDIDGDALSYRASPSDPRVVAAGVAGSVLTLTPLEYGSAVVTVVTVTAEDGEGLTAEQMFAVGVNDDLACGAVWQTLAGMARGHLASARMTLGRRASSNGVDGGSRLTVLGRQVPLGNASAQSAAAQLLAGWAAGAGGYGRWRGRPGLGGDGYSSATGSRCSFRGPTRCRTTLRRSAPLRSTRQAPPTRQSPASRTTPDDAAGATRVAQSLAVADCVRILRAKRRNSETERVHMSGTRARSSRL